MISKEGETPMDERTQREPGQEQLRTGRWWCRPHLWHRWRTHRYPNSADYGARYQECLDCGKQRDVPVSGGIMP
jgi:hypothetical protein